MASAPPPSVPTDVDLVVRARAGGADAVAARDELTQRYQPLVHAASRRHRVAGDDGSSCAQVGLQAAIRDYDPDRGVPFAAYARAKVHGELMRWHRANRYVVHVPRPLHELHMQVRAVARDLEAGGHRPTVEDVARELDLPVEAVTEALAVGAAESWRRAHPDAPTPQEPASPSPEEHVGLHLALEDLDDREHRVIHGRYWRGLSQQELATELEVSQPTISRLERSGLQLLGRALGDDEG